MFSEDLLDAIYTALDAGDLEAIRELEHQYGHVAGLRVAIFLASEGGGAVYDDAGLLERIDARED